MIVDVGPSTFACGMAYVALSRVTSLKGLHLMDIDRQKLSVIQKLSKNIIVFDNYTLHIETQSPTTAEKTTKQRQPSEQQQHTGAEDMSAQQPAVQTPAAGKEEKRQKADQTQTRHLRSAARGKKKNKQKTEQQIADHISSSFNNTAVEVGTSNQSQQQVSVFNYCKVYSVDESYQKYVCQQLNLQHFSHDSTMPELLLAAAEQLSAYMYRQTQQQTCVKVYRIPGFDGNCLFRALSTGITRSQSQHDLLRSYIINHMLDDSITDGLQNLYARNNDEYQRQLQDMEQPGEWGTDCQIAAAAHLFQLSILCFSQYSESGQYHFQHFPPHFPINQD